MGTWDHPPLSKDPLPAGGDTDRSERWPLDHWEACQEQTETHHSGDGREAGSRFEGRQICGVLRSDTGESYCHTEHIRGIIYVHEHISSTSPTETASSVGRLTCKGIINEMCRWTVDVGKSVTGWLDWAESKSSLKQESGSSIAFGSED